MRVRFPPRPPQARNHVGSTEFIPTNVGNRHRRTRILNRARVGWSRTDCRITPQGRALPALTYCDKCLILLLRGGAVVARRAHNPKVAGAIPAPATNLRRRAKVAHRSMSEGGRLHHPSWFNGFGWRGHVLQAAKTYQLKTLTHRGELSNGCL